MFKILPAFFAATLLGTASAASTLQKIQTAQVLNCGVDVEEAEYTMADAHGNHVALDGDFCKAVSVAVLGPNAHYNIKNFRDEASGLRALQSGEVDVVASGSANLRTTNGSFSVARPIFYDYQGILVNKTINAHRASDLAGKKVCFLIGTEIQTQVDAYMAREKIAYIPGPFSEEGEMEVAFVTKTCAAVTADVTQLASERSSFKNLSSQFEILPDVIAVDPLAPVTRADDPQWSAIVDWTVQALVEAERLGITQKNLPEIRKSSDIVSQRFLGTNKGWGQFLGLDDAWASRIILAVGNYGEVFERDLGVDSPMRLNRGANKLWTEGGLMFANPIR